MYMITVSAVRRATNDHVDDGNSSNNMFIISLSLSICKHIYIYVYTYICIYIYI